MNNAKLDMKLLPKRLLPMTMIHAYETIAYDYDSLTMRLLPMTLNKKLL